MNCIFYDRVLQKKVPCILIPGKIYKKTDGMKRCIFVKVRFDETKFTEYSLSEGELSRYSSEFVKLSEIYPANTTGEITYLNTVIPNVFTNNVDELNRYESIITMLVNSATELSAEEFYLLSDFISYELLFTICTLQERQFMGSLSYYFLTEQPAQILIPQMVRMTKLLFSKYTAGINASYDIDNYNGYYSCETSLPITLNLDNLKHNVNFIIL